MAAIGTSVEYILDVKGDSIKRLKSGKYLYFNLSTNYELILFIFILSASLLHFITRFSIHQNTSKLLTSTRNQSNSPLRCLDGMR